MSDGYLRVKHFIETYCRQSKHPWNGKPIKLLPWQQDILRAVYGTTKGNERQYRRAGIWIPKKNGKTTLMSALALYHLLEYPGSECYIVASNVRQADICFGEAANMAETHPVLNKRLWTRRNVKTVEDRKGKSILKILSSEPHGLSGFNANLIIMDELAEWGCTAREAWDKLYNASIARANSMHYVISTAQYDRTHIGYEQYSLAKKILANPALDPTFYPTIYGVPEDADWKDYREWQKANPSWGHTITAESFHEDFKTVQANPVEEARFRTFRCNQWVGNSQQWISSQVWADCHETFREEDFHNQPVYVGIDYARRHDLCSYVLVAEKNNNLYVMPRFLIPGDIARQKEIKDAVPYQAWARGNNNLFLTDGDVIDAEFLIKKLVEDSNRFKFVEVGFDPYGMELIRHRLEFDHGLPMVEVAQTASIMSPAVAQFERSVLKKQLRHNNNPILSWNVQNVTTRKVGESQIMLDKGRSTNRIDGVTATVIALQRWLANQSRPRYLTADQVLVSW